MKSKILITNAIFAISDSYLIITGYLNFNLIFHSHIIELFVGRGDGYLGLFWLICFVHDLVFFNLVILIIYLFLKMTKRGLLKGSQKNA
jgi:hypothetical protein